MDKMKLDNLIRRYTIHHEDESYIEMKDLQTTSEDFCKDEIILEKIEKSLKKDLNILLFMELKHRKKLKKKRIVPALQWECGYYSYLILLYHVF